ncbi:hypothetical protein JZ751_014659 [Albula glossodonta]|uniref:Secreted protein n=1 Tax=Albula glossodonta TaxID=121402 RepID=A0A8T2N2A0_9TELE|nr:hypothetical protein JZ751_014659 [Albula glossodonta]
MKTGYVILLMSAVLLGTSWIPCCGQPCLGKPHHLLTNRSNGAFRSGSPGIINGGEEQPGPRPFRQAPLLLLLLHRCPPLHWADGKDPQEVEEAHSPEGDYLK